MKSTTQELGANIQYFRPLSEEEKASQFRWSDCKRRLIVKTLKSLPRRQHVADFGCRMGVEAAHYQEQADISEMHGFEVHEAPLEHAKALGLVTHVWISGESSCPVEDDYFDVVIVGDLIEHLVDTDFFLRELQRVVKPGGYLVLTTPNLAWWWSRIRLLFGKVPHGMGSVSFNYAKDNSVDKNHLRLSINSEWVNLFDKHDFECVSIHPYHYPSILSTPFRLIDKIASHFSSIAHSNLYLLKNPD